MRRLFSASMANCVASGVVLGGLLGAVPAQALTQQEIIDKLEQVPVFLILNSEGRPLTASASSAEGEEKLPVVFTDADTAEGFLANAREQDAEAQITPVDLGTLYEETQVQENVPPTLLYFPDEQELQAAVSIEDDFQGVPLFIARQSQEGPYLTITRGEETFLPMFFSQEDLQLLLNRYEEQNPQESSDIEVEVLSLEWLLQMMTTNQDPELDQQLSQIQLVPSADVVQYLRSQPGSDTPAE
ncbi:hypothetical protein C7271_05750 [filamentous cyanobacterium CCP5]|nr:hypothetical protein C7271_05750 [filamentous cyanobacterium CCP5]